MAKYEFEGIYSKPPYDRLSEIYQHSFADNFNLHGQDS